MILFLIPATVSRSSEVSFLLRSGGDAGLQVRTFTAPTYTTTDLLRVSIPRYKSGQS